MKQGKVWLVGAGPGDMGLLTLKGKEVLEQADVVLYDKLVGTGILNMIPDSAQKINVGKCAGNHTMPQAEINLLLLSEAQKGNHVVRLKGGDPFLFGRGGEELELLEKHHIPFEVVPGVTSAVSVPAYAGIPVTHRNFASSVHIITGHKKADENDALDFTALSQLEGTLVFLMGVSALDNICSGLVQAGKSTDTPAAILEQGTTAHQRRIVADLKTLPEKAKQANIQTPAIIVVGTVCTLAEQFAWAEKRPLGQSRIIVTRPRQLISSFSKKLRDLGADVIELPAIRTEEIAENPALDHQLQHLHQVHWLVFTSAAGVTVFFQRLKAQHIDIRTLAHLKFVAIGRATQKAIEAYGIFTDYIPEIYHAEALAQGLVKHVKQGETVLLPRAMEGTPCLTEILENHNISYIDLPVYRTVYKTPVPCSLENVDAVAFTSASTVRGFCNAMQNQSFTHLRAYCIGNQTADEAKKFGFANCIIAKEAAIDSLVQIIVETETAKKERN